jgi:hypothetical protein
MLTKLSQRNYEKRSIEAIKRRSSLNSQSYATAPSRLKSSNKSTANTSVSSSINLPKHAIRTNVLLDNQIKIKLPDLNSLLRWSVNEGIQKEHASKILTHVENNFTTTISNRDYEGWASVRARRARLATVASKQLGTVEPVGLLHLERLNFVPAGIERGELVHSVPLTPGEEVNITHKEWSNTSEEFSKIVTDFMEAYSEEGVTEKAELTQSSSSQEQHSSGFNTGVTASGGVWTCLDLNITWFYCL